MKFDTEQECLDQQYVLETRFAEYDTDFTYHLYCFHEDLEVEYD